MTKNIERCFNDLPCTLFVAQFFLKSSYGWSLVATSKIWQTKKEKKKKTIGSSNLVTKTSDRAGVNQQPLVHQFRMRPFKLFWGWTKKHILFPCPGILQPPSLPQNFPILPSSPLLPPSPHFPLTPSLELERAPKLE
jgi:hypothetical protein